MSNLSTTSNSYTATSGATYNVTGGPFCGIHGQVSCTCTMNGGFLQSTTCNVCGNVYYIGSLHQCPLPQSALGQSYCGICCQIYNPQTTHTCSSLTGGSNILSITAGGTCNQISWTISPTFKEVKEITTDAEVIYEWNGGSFNIKLPAKFSDCFLKVGYVWSPLYPLIFSAFENDSKEMSFHLVTGIINKVFEGDLVILQAVSTIKIEDNLTLMQLTNRVKTYFNDNDKADSSI